MSETKQKANPVPIRIPVDREDEFKRMVSDSGLSRNAFIIECIFGRSRHRPAEQKFLARILGMLAEIRDLLREIVRDGAGHNTLAIDQTREELIKIRNLVMQALGRRS